MQYETFELEGSQVVEKVKHLIHEGDVRRILIQHEGRTVAEFPLTAGVVGAVFAPMLAAVGALAALLGHCTVAVERQPAPALAGRR